MLSIIAVIDRSVNTTMASLHLMCPIICWDLNLINLMKIDLTLHPNMILERLCFPAAVEDLPWGLCRAAGLALLKASNGAFTVHLFPYRFICRIIFTSSDCIKGRRKKSNQKHVGLLKMYFLCFPDYVTVALGRVKGITSPRHGHGWHVAYCTFTMSSFDDLHCRKGEMSVTAPFISIETILTGMATVRPVRIAVLMISVSCGEGRKRHSERRRAIYINGTLSVGEVCI